MPHLEAFYGGSAGGGKSDALLMAALQYVDVPGYAALILRRTFPELSQPGAIMARSHEWLQSTDAVWNEQKKRWTFPSGATLTFGYLQRTTDVYQYQGAEFQFISLDELTQFEEWTYVYLFSRLRRLEGAQVPLRMRSASNPGNIGHGWVKKRFVNEETRDGRVYIPAKLVDNPHLDHAEYRASLSQLGETLQAQLLDGDWGAFEGMAFAIDRDAHYLTGFELEDHLDRFESMDYGLNNPTVWLAWAVDHEGNLVIFDEHSKPALPSETAPIVLALRRAWGSSMCVGDPNSLAMRTGTLRKLGDPATIQTEFADHGVLISKGNDNPRAGYTRLRELLNLDEDRRFPDWHPRRGEHGAPRLFVVRNACPNLCEQLESAPLQPIDKPHAGEMVDPLWEGPHGHAVAAARYGALSRPGPATLPEQEHPDPRAEYLRQIEARQREEDDRDDYDDWRD